MAVEVQACMEETDYLGPFRSGFRPGHGTEASLVDDIWQERDRGTVTLLVLLDLSAALNIVDHSSLLEGGGGNVLQWFCSCP